ncbi:hypothetical protein [Microbacterium tumbae]
MPARHYAHRPPLEALSDVLEVVAVLAVALLVLTTAAVLLTEVFA